MGCVSLKLPSLRIVVLIVLATFLVLTISTANATPCSSLSCVDVSSAACKFCNRRAGKRSENYAWRDGREPESSNRGSLASGCFLDSLIAGLPHDLQEQVFEVLEVVVGMER